MLLKNKRIAQIIEGLNEFNTPPQPPPPTEPKPNGTQTPPAAVGVSKAELTSAIENARAEEKKKLYGEIEKLKTAGQEATAQLKSVQEADKKRKQEKLTGEEQLQSQMAELQSQNEASNAQVQALIQSQIDDRNAYEMNLYREKVIRDAGPYIMPDLVRGSSRSEIEQSVMVAKAEYAHWQQHFTQQPSQQAYQVQPGTPQQVLPQQLPTQIMTTQPQVGVPPGPSVTNPAPVQPDGLDPQYVQHVTTLDSVRSGEYAKNREVILARIRQGVTPQPGMALPMRPMGPQAAPQTAPQFQGHPQMTQQMPHVQLPGGVQQPQGLPTPPVQNPNMQQHGNMGMPSAQYPQQPSVPAVVPGSVQDMRAQAAVAANAALHNPQAALAVAGNPPVASHPEYIQPNPSASGAPVPSAQQLASGHPQIR